MNPMRGGTEVKKDSKTKRALNEELLDEDGFFWYRE
jgi:hypothetical protein